MTHYGQVTQVRDQTVAYVHDVDRRRSHPVNLDALAFEGPVRIGDFVAFTLDERQRNVLALERIDELPGDRLPFFTTDQGPADRGDGGRSVRLLR